jgi:DNA-binding MarR family transcriptional regulator
MDNVVDENKVNQVVDSGKSAVGSSSDGGRASGASGDGRGFELPLLLFAGFRALIDELHVELAQQGHPDVRPAHGFAMQAIGVGPGGASTSEVGRRLGVSKQAAGKTVDRLVELGYAERSDDPHDARRKLVRLTPHGLDALRRSAAIMDELHARWAETLGRRQLRELEDTLRSAVPADAFRLDAAAWLRA